MFFLDSSFLKMMTVLFSITLRDLDPAPNPPHFPSHVIKATFAYISNCHKTKLKSILEILSKSPVSILY